jgi:uncharacterized coiled-coil protein SlyX
MTETPDPKQSYANEESITDLQMRLAFAEQAHADLDDIVAQQSVMIRELKRQIEELREALEDASRQWGETPLVERPPHY